MADLPIARLYGQRLCDAWGLDSSKVMRIEIVLGPNDPPYANIVALVEDEAVTTLLELMPIPAQYDGKAGDD